MLEHPFEACCSASSSVNLILEIQPNRQAALLISSEEWRDDDHPTEMIYVDRLKTMSWLKRCKDWPTSCLNHLVQVHGFLKKGGRDYIFGKKQLLFFLLGYFFHLPFFLFKDHQFWWFRAPGRTKKLWCHGCGDLQQDLGWKSPPKSGENGELAMMPFRLWCEDWCGIWYVFSRLAHVLYGYIPSMIKISGFFECRRYWVLRCVALPVFDMKQHGMPWCSLMAYLGRI